MMRREATRVVALVIALGLAWAAAPAAGQDAPGRVAPGQDAARQAGAAVDSLLARGRLQEAAWALREAGDTTRAAGLLGRLDSILRARPERARPLSMDSQGVSYTWRLQHGGGVESIFKVDGSDIFCPECGADREVATYRLDALLGFDLTPMTVFTRIANERGDSLSGSTMYFVHDARSPREAGVTKPDALRLFDAIIGNSDRHRDNWLVVGGRVVGIDHNRAFEYEPTTRPKTCWEMQVDSMAEPGALGRPWERFRTLPADSFEAALAGTDPALVRRLLAARPDIIARVEARIERPDRELPHTDCVFPEGGP